MCDFNNNKKSDRQLVDKKTFISNSVVAWMLDINVTSAERFMMFLLHASSILAYNKNSMSGKL
jgi:hypothetical protein